MRLSNFTLSTVLKGCANSGRLREGQVVHSLAIKGGCELDEILGCSFVDMYSKCGLAIDALNVFMRIKNPDVVAWSAMITCLDKQGLWQEAAYLFRLMRSKGVRPNHFSFSSILSSASHLGDLRFGESIHACIWKFGFENEVLVSNALISMYTKNGSIQDGTQVFEAMKIRDLVSWNALLSGFHDEELCNLGPKIFHQLLVEGFKPNIYTFISILRAWVKTKESLVRNRSDWWFYFLLFHKPFRFDVKARLIFKVYGFCDGCQRKHVNASGKTVLSLKHKKPFIALHLHELPSSSALNFSFDRSVEWSSSQFLQVWSVPNYCYISENAASILRFNENGLRVLHGRSINLQEQKDKRCNSINGSIRFSSYVINGIYPRFAPPSI
ncbi:hypothetical protein FEM48_Zijuj07G0014900 [Ziziphus jujuba var. spinosa]|uniref:Uncharacterized protein n=1 Tax=Ziziphus jujuba var. spinosa TaxID=714518 RepID=A0A978V1N4_ZIZJJ|nr:hypothetical protein FEM48_Zijuj07G0014900 [Ziziphus jujuba var. spinosa]